MGELVIYLVLVVFASVCIGVIIGVLGSQRKHNARIEEAYTRGRREQEEEKAILAKDLKDELSRIRASIMQTLDVYDNAVRVVETRLVDSSSGDVKRLAGPAASERRPMIAESPSEVTIDVPAEANSAREMKSPAPKLSPVAAPSPGKNAEKNGDKKSADRAPKTDGLATEADKVGKPAAKSAPSGVIPPAAPKADTASKAALSTKSADGVGANPVKETKDSEAARTNGPARPADERPTIVLR